MICDTAITGVEEGATGDVIGEAWSKISALDATERSAEAAGWLATAGDRKEEYLKRYEGWLDITVLSGDPLALADGLFLWCGTALLGALDDEMIAPPGGVPSLTDRMREMMGHF